MAILNDLEVPVWLDQGSLLGAIRDGRFLPKEWDGDIDLGVWKSEIKKVFPDFAHRLRVIGARVDFPPGSGTMMIRPSRHISGRPVNIGAYKTKGEFVEKKSALVREHIDPPKALLKRVGRAISPPLLRAARRLINKSLSGSGTKGSTSARLQYRLGSILNQTGLWVRFYSNKRITFRTHGHYFHEFTSLRIYDMGFLIPKEAHGYLQYKYGDDWHVPKREWVFWEDDGAVVKGTPSDRS